MEETDWTDRYDRLAIIRLARDLIDDLISEVHRRKLDIHRDLSVTELGLLYRFPLHVGVNIFFERLMRVAHLRETGWPRSYPAVPYRLRYFRDTNEAVTHYYLDFAINTRLLYEIYSVMDGPDESVQKDEFRAGQSRPQDEVLRPSSGILSVSKSAVKKLIEFYVKISKPEVVGDYSNWMREILPYTQMLSFHEPAARKYLQDERTRAEIKRCCRTIFFAYIDRILNNLDPVSRGKLADIFTDYLDHILPQSVVEGLPERWSYFENLTRKWKIRQVHSFIGYYYNENFKIFAALARRRGACLIGHAHGTSNPRPLYRQICNELAFLDFYFSWGKNDGDWMKGDRKLQNLKVCGLGSTYLATMPRWNKRSIEPDSITLLYPSGPLVDFMTDLEETATREKTRRHRLDVLHFLKALREAYPGMKILYKPFPGTYTQDPIKEIFGKELQEGKIRTFDERPSALYDKSDIVLWDCISTGFAESIQARVPTLVFQSPQEYEWASSLGKELNQDLMRAGVIVHSVGAGLESVQRILRGDFGESSRGPLLKFQEAVAYPVSKEEFLRRSLAVLGGVN